MSGQELLELADKLASMHERFHEAHVSLLKAVTEAANPVAKSWSGSNLGYHADVYYSGLKPRPPGAQFSSEWGIQERYGGLGSKGDWQEFARDEVIAAIYQQAGNPDLSAAREASVFLAREVEPLRAELISALTIAVQNTPDPFLKSLLEKADQCVIRDTHEIIDALVPSGQLMTRDSLAANQGRRAAPHQSVIADMTALAQPSACAKELSSIARQAGSHLVRLDRRTKKSALVGTNVFIGHGRAPAWRVLKDFIRDRMNLPYDEFNRVPVAGVTNIARLSEMLDSAAIAFLILTAEDEQADGRQHARMNVIHEVGLFQGRLGFSRAIVLLEQGCEEFSNIQGLGQIRFPKDNIAAAFEDIRLVLEREGLVDS
jgi:predicted nucleotide-binding protein